MNIKNKIITVKNISVIFTALSILPILLTCFYIFPINNGWWPYYNYLEFNNLRMYADFNNVYAPLFTRFVEPIAAISFRPIVSLSFGILRVYFLFFLVYYLLRKYFDWSIALLGSYILVIFQIQSSVFMPDDYHIFERTVLILCFFVYSNIILDTENSNIYFKTTLLALLSSLLIYSKQNVGILCSLSFYLGLIRYDILSEKKRYINLIYIIQLIIGVLFFGKLLGINYDQFLEISIRNDSKGTSLSILTNFLLNKNNYDYIVMGLFSATALFFVVDTPFISNIKINIHKKLNNSKILNYSNYKLFIFILLIYLFNRFYKHSEPIVVAIAVVSIISLTFLSVLSKNKIFSLIYPGLGLLYANSMTSDFAGEALILVVVPIICILINVINFHKIKFNYILLVLFITIYSASIFFKKANTPYSWWGFTQSRITEAYYAPPYEMLSGLKVDRATNEVLEKIKYYIDNYSFGKSDVYLYPHLPFFYILHNKLPPTKNSIQWFDVIKNSEMNNEVDYIKKSNNLNLIILFDPPYSVYNGHQNMKKIRLPQFEFIDQINELQKSNKYELIDYTIFKNNLNLNKNGQADPDVMVKINNPNIFGKKYGEVLNELKSKNFLITSLISGNLKYDLDSYSNFYSREIKSDDMISVRGDTSSIEGVVVKFGYIDKIQEDWFSLKVYKKRENKASY